MTILEKLQHLADKISQEQSDIKEHRYPDSYRVSGPDKVTIKIGRKYANIDVGPLHNMSGRYMVELDTGEIYGIKAYGVIHRGHHYGNLDTIDDFYWGEYRAFRKNPSIGMTRGKYLYGTYSLKRSDGSHIRMATYVQEKSTNKRVNFMELIPQYLAFREAKYQFKKS